MSIKKLSGFYLTRPHSCLAPPYGTVAAGGWTNQLAYSLNATDV